MKLPYETLREHINYGIEPDFFYKSRYFCICGYYLEHHGGRDFREERWSLIEENDVESKQEFKSGDELLDNATIDGKLLSEIWYDDELICESGNEPNISNDMRLTTTYK